MNLYIIIVSFNGGKTLDRLISDLIKEGGVEIVVVENGKEERNKNHRSRITLLKNKKNLGFAGGCNVGIKFALRSGADKILLLNPDVMIDGNFIRNLIKTSADADIISPVIKFKRANDWIYDYGGKIDWRLGRTSHLESIMPPTSFQAQSRNLSRMRDFNSNKLRDPSASVGMTNVDYVSGCAMLVRREVIEKIGLFDERFFLYFEDVDLCLRAKRAGFQVAVDREALIIHNLIEGKERSFFKNYHLLRSNFIFINKYLGINRLLGYLYLLLLIAKIMLIDNIFLSSRAKRGNL